MDLVVRNAQLVDRPAGALCDVGVSGGKIVAIEAGLAVEAETFDARGRLVCGGLIETHIHLDKARLLDVLPPERGRAIRPVPYVAQFKPQITCEEIRERAESCLRQCICHGTTRMRSHVEVDPRIGMRGFEAVQSLVDDYKWAIDLELCVFPQDGLINNPGTDQLLVEGLKRGAKVLGAAPRYDTDAEGQIRRIFALAREFDVDIDMHLDVGPSADHLDVVLVCDLTEEYGLGGRVSVGHMTKLSLMPPDALAAISRRMADVGVAVAILPATDLYLMGRDKDHAVPRGVADAHFLCAQGVNCSLSTNNVLNPATPFGDCSLLRIANLQANVLQTGEPEQLRECFAMLTERPARMLNHGNYGVAVGNPADLLVLDAASPEQAVAEIRRPLAVFKNGQRTVTWHPPELAR